MIFWTAVGGQELWSRQGFANSGTADSTLKAAHVVRTRQVHQVTVSSLYFLLQKAFSQEADEGQDLEDWCAEHLQASPQFHLWWINLHLAWN